MQKNDRPARETDKHAKQPRARFIDPDDPRRRPLGRLRTEEEARLAAEIEKLRD